jgi:hypothetical protein
MSITPEAGVPPKATSSTAQNPEDIINIDDIPEEPTAESDKGASSSQPMPEDTNVTLAEATANDVKKKLLLSGATGTPQTHPHLFPNLQWISLSQHHSDMTNLMNEVWVNPESEQKYLTALEGSLRTFFAKHKHLHLVTLPPSIGLEFSE